ARLRLGPDPAAVALDDLLADREADPGPGVAVPRVQALEDDEDPLRVPHLEADAVVSYRDDPLLAFAVRLDPDVRRILPAELDRVRDQVLEELADLVWVDLHAREIAGFDPGAALLDRDLHAVEDIPQDRREVRREERPAVRADAGESEEIEDQVVHPRRALGGVADALVGVRTELALVAALEELDVGPDHAQGLLKVVRGDVGELLELRVAALERRRARLELRLRAAQVLDVAPDAQHHRPEREQTQGDEDEQRRRENRRLEPLRVPDPQVADPLRLLDE